MHVPSALAVLLAVSLAGGVLYVSSQKSEPEVPMQTVGVNAPRPAFRVVPPGYTHYWNDEYQFSLWHPDGMGVSEIPHEERRATVVFQNPQTYVGFQIYVTPYFSETITEEQFAKDVPSLVRENVRNVEIDGTAAVRFESRDELFGDTEELWFIRYGYLYEVTTSRETPEQIDALIDNWQFY